MAISVRTLGFSLAVAAAFTVAAAALSRAADEPGNAAAGRTFAEEVCASCHAIAPDGTRSPEPKAPTFQQVADTPGMNRLALIVFFRTPHKDMPNLLVHGPDGDNVIAYILSLQSKK